MTTKKEVILKMSADGSPVPAIAKHTGVSYSYVYRVLQEEESRKQSDPVDETVEEMVESADEGEEFTLPAKKKTVVGPKKTVSIQPKCPNCNGGMEEAEFVDGSIEGVVWYCDNCETAWRD